MTVFSALHTPLVGAHRGASGEAPENTFAAFDLALQQGAELIEFDVHQTSDGVLVVHHDFDVARTTGRRGQIAAMTWPELQRCDAGSWRGSQWRGERIPTLDAILDRYGPRVLLNVEIKVEQFRYPEIEAHVAAAIASRGLQDRVIVSTFDATCVERLRSVAPAIQTGVLAEDNPDEAIARAAARGAVSVHLAPDLITAARVRQAHGSGLGVLAWTVDDEVEMVRLVELGIDAVLTNFPGRLRDVIVARR